MTQTAVRFKSPGCWLLAAVLWWSGLPASADTFSGPIVAAEWHLDASVFECSLLHPINQFGAAVFSHKAGEQQRFYLRQSNTHLPAGQAQLSSQHPVWRENPGVQLLQTIELAEAEQVVSLGRESSLQMISQLRSGRQLVVTRPAWQGRERPSRVVIEPVGFRPALRAYQECRAGLLPVNYEQVARTALYYTSGDHELPERELQKLHRVALYAVEDDRVSAIYVDGHTDGVGLSADNLELSRERAEFVSDYLVERGVDPGLVVTRWHGQRYPVGSNRESEGRAQNRRVTVRLERADERLSNR